MAVVKGSDWARTAVLYFLDVNGMVKIGITTDLKATLENTRKNVKGVTVRLTKQVEFDRYWKAELVEQVMKQRLKSWRTVEGQDWISLPFQNVMDCYSQTKKEMSKEFEKFAGLHKKGESRHEHYRQIAEMYFG